MTQNEQYVLCIKPMEISFCFALVHCMAVNGKNCGDVCVSNHNVPQATNTYKVIKKS